MSVDLESTHPYLNYRMPRVPPVPPNATVGQRWRFRRNLIIYVANRSGVSQRMLAEVFDLPRSRIGEIVQDLRRYEAGMPPTTQDEGASGES